jgi:uncharacterized phage protein (TIGR02218 family)
MGAKDDLLAHLATGTTTTCRCWGVTRTDGVFLGFTDHDRDLTFDDRTYRAATGLSARALQMGTGLSVDNSEAMGALTSAAISEADIAAGRFDGAEILCWMVNWADPSARMLLFRGRFGEVVRQAGAFSVELRGLSDALNQMGGQVYVKTCTAVLGDARCRFDLDQAGFSVEVPLAGRDAQGRYLFDQLPETEEHWFERGRIVVLNGLAAGQVGLVKFDQTIASQRTVELWSKFATDPAPGDLIRLEAGCDKVSTTCQKKFNNFLNFRGFPQLPGEDWLTSYPVSSSVNDGGSLVR